MRRSYVIEQYLGKFACVHTQAHFLGSVLETIDLLFPRNIM